MATIGPDAPSATEAQVWSVRDEFRLRLQAIFDRQAAGIERVNARYRREREQLEQEFQARLIEVAKSNTSG